MAENKAKDDKSPARLNDEVGQVAKKEESILRFWQDHQIFQKSEQKNAGADYVFYDGPPFATGLPHYGHLLAGTMKDVIPRYQSMRGRRVRRRWGWDCHGLPLENVIEQELGLKTKKDILDFGIGNFNEAARKAVLRYADDWRAIVPRLGRWVDMDDDYKTMDASYTESVWWIFKNLYDRGLIYEGKKSMHLCPRCETTLSNFEVNQGYKDIEDLTVTVKFALIDEPDTYLLAWTTTPWTLPGNVALAVNPEIKYAFVQSKDAGQTYVVAEDRVEKIFGPESKILKTISGQKLIGQKYQTVFDYYQNEGEIYSADFVTTEEGTGIVHIAPAFGDDDYQLCQQENLPFIQHVGTDGKFKPEVKDFADLLVKPKDHHQETDKLVVKKLTAEGKVFATELLTHSYPHCWRCETPLLNYAANSWFVQVSKFKDKLVAANQEINWVPEHLKEGRFGKWLLGARDWAISRSRFWGAPIPVWRCEACAEQAVIGSLSDLKKYLSRPKNNYWTIRHGEATSNVDNRVSSRVGNDDCLTETGRAEVVAAVASLVDEKIDLIFSSDFLRTRQTAELLAEHLGLSKTDIIFDQRLWEINAGELEGEDWSNYESFFAHHKRSLESPLPGGESLLQVRRRTLQFLLEIEGKYEGKNILIVTHGLPLLSLLAGAAGVPDEKLAELKVAFGPVKRAKPYPVELNFYPRNEAGALDVHRPFIDEVPLRCPCGGEFKRVPEVFDCWFESGSMPYGQAHYPFSQSGLFDPTKKVGFPAQFIAEGLDQTRGWFYSLLVLGVALFGESPYKNVIVNGLVLAEDGQKMSKRLKNYPDPVEIINRYGADTLRFYLMSMPVVRAEDLNFSERGVAETHRQVIQRLLNVVNFYQTYAAGEVATFSDNSSAPLDRWILARLQQAAQEVGAGLEAYELDRAARPIFDLIDDLSNWYVRRSRERFKSEDEIDSREAKATTLFVLRELAKIIAPFMPFMAESMWQDLRQADDALSVHLVDWPDYPAPDEELLTQMKTARNLVEAALAARQAAGVKVRQPLPRLTVKDNLSADILAIIAAEVNVKLVTVNSSQANLIELETELTPELKAEGEMRELVRHLQEERKRLGLVPADKITATIPKDYVGLVNIFAAEIKKAVNAAALEVGDTESFIITKL